MKTHGTDDTKRGLGQGIRTGGYLWGDRLYQRGFSPPGVEQLQKDLNALGADLAVDGIFGPNTEQAVRDFQQQVDITVDGIVGPETKTAIKDELGITVTEPPTSFPTPSPGSDPETREENQDASTEAQQAEFGVGEAILTATTFGGVGYYLWREYQKYHT